MNRVELLAPAGDPDAAYAALHYGADAIYLGLKKFSARAEAANFNLAELSEILAFAHAATPARRVYVAINTLITNRELGEVIEALAAVSELGADAVIVQDLGVVRLVRRHFPRLPLHASTQLAVHSLAGARTLRKMGFKRVTLARELTLPEIGEIVRESGIEVEVFIHGALCYAYSGLCLYSSMFRGRSGNRGRCTYPCRDAFDIAEDLSVAGMRAEDAPGADRRQGTRRRVERSALPARADGSGPDAPRFPFSMKDLALPDDLHALRKAGVASFKIEGRKKSPLYVACTTSYYRGLLDGTLQGRQKDAAQADIKTVFSRPWTRLYVGANRNDDVADADTVGHRGAPIGSVEAVLRQGRASWLRFATGRRLERHDGLQLDIPGQGRPFGFAVDRIRLVPDRSAVRNQGAEVFEVPVGALIDVRLPDEHPVIPARATVYCSSSQEVKRRYRCDRPKPGLFRVRNRLDVTVEVSGARVLASGRVVLDAARGPGVQAEAEAPGCFESCRDAATVEQAAREAFGKLGDTAFVLGAWTLHNPDRLFVPVSVMNRLRRELVGKLETAWEQRQEERIAAVRQEEDAPGPAAPGGARRGQAEWCLKTDRIACLDEFAEDDWQGMAELVVDIGHDSGAALLDRLAAWSALLARERIRLALPMIARRWEEAALREKVRALRAAGWNRWEIANLSGWEVLTGSAAGAGAPLDLATDWSVYVTNRAAARQVLELGASQFVLSPEDGVNNMSELLAEFGAQTTVVVYQDTPLFVSENCAVANVAGGCVQAESCRHAEAVMLSRAGERVRVLQDGCRTIVLNERPFTLGARVRALEQAGAVRVRADFVYRRYAPAQVREIWRTLRNGRKLPAGQEGNFLKGLEP